MITVPLTLHCDQPGCSGAEEFRARATVMQRTGLTSGNFNFRAVLPNELCGWVVDGGTGEAYCPVHANSSLRRPPCA